MASERVARGLNWFIRWTGKKWIELFKQHRELGSSHGDILRGRKMVAAGQKLVNERQLALNRCVKEQIDFDPETLLEQQKLNNFWKK